ncbi:PAP2 superfamily-domain-containing protein [Mycena maculata]|uniref:PAP2 superfamily-domain-containing protein n=1 Tax=Mycena maculata TaxID=230809 RepID=A0AAD7JN67_9AGAR|nr:PAP2 superfamily-domain-containing protein [Mycena maculata]
MGSTVKNIVEPLVILAIFAIGIQANRRRQLTNFRDQWPTSPHIPDAEIPLLRHSTPETTRMNGIRIPDNRRFRRNFISKLLARYPFAMEVFYWNLTYWPYQLARAASAIYLNANPQRRAIVTTLAQAHASQIIALEEKLGIAVELAFQRYILRCMPLVMTLMSAVYLAHISVGIAFLAYGFTYFPRARFQVVRRAIALDNLLAFPLLSLWRCAPPRLMLRRLGFIDILHPPPGVGGETSAWANNRFQLTLAAMPSLHFGTAVLLGMSVALWGRHTWLRVLAPLYPIIMALTVVATANHWILDCVVGVCVVAAGLYFNRVLLLLQPFEEWLFWILRAERPRDRVEEEDDLCKIEA